MLLLCLTALADDLPPAPEIVTVPQQMEDPPDFGADASVGYAIGSLLGNWPQSGVHGAVLGRYEAFIAPRTAPGPRLGLSLWGSAALWPLQSRTEDGEEDTFSYLPTLTFEAGARQRLVGHSFIDWMARVHWATGRDPTGLGFEEWWLAQLAVTVGGHLR
jgi:hypothetical protein